MASVDNITGNSDLRKRILFTLAVLAIYRIGVHVPIPGVDGARILAYFTSQDSGILGMFNTFTGGALSQFSIFALSIMPYISASIIFSLLTTAVPYLESLKKEGATGQRKINQYTRYATILIAVIQGYGISSMVASHSYQGHPIVIASTIGVLPFKLMAVLTLCAGTTFVMWMGEQITERGIGNGSSLIIFTNIAASIPRGASSLWALVSNRELNVAVVFGLLIFMIAVIAAVIYLEVAQRRIPIQYSQRTGAPGSAAPSSHLPIKINFSGVIPPIFASSLLLFPATIGQVVQTGWLKALKDTLAPSGSVYNILFVSLIIFFCFFYTEVVFNPVEVSDNLKKFGGFIPGIRAGKSTSDYIQKVLNRVNVVGAVYLSVICVLPGILISQMKVPFYFGGTSLIILVGVAIDTSQQIQSHIISSKYQGFLSGSKIRSRRVQF